MVDIDGARRFLAAEFENAGLPHVAGDILAGTCPFGQGAYIAAVAAALHRDNGHSSTPVHAGTDPVPLPMFYIQDTRQYVGNCPVWWGPNGGGYVTRLDEAGRYTETEAIAQNRTRHTDIPWPCAEIDSIARPTVDAQHMRSRKARLAELADADKRAVRNG